MEDQATALMDNILVLEEIEAMENDIQQQEKQRSMRLPEDIQLVDLFAAKGYQPIQAQNDLQELQEAMNEVKTLESTPRKEKDVLSKSIITRQDKDKRKKVLAKEYFEKANLNNYDGQERNEIKFGAHRVTLQKQRKYFPDKTISSTAQNEEKRVILPSSANREASLLACIIVCVSIETNYPTELYEKLFPSKALDNLLMNMRKDERLLAVEVLKDW